MPSAEPSVVFIVSGHRLIVPRALSGGLPDPPLPRDKALCVYAASPGTAPRTPPPPPLYPHTRGHCVVSPAVTTSVMAATHTAAASHDLLPPSYGRHGRALFTCRALRPLIVSTRRVGAAEGTMRRHVRRESSVVVGGGGGHTAMCIGLPRSSTPEPRPRVRRFTPCSLGRGSANY